jgi:phospholipid transport system substrate-binding protein
VPLAPTRRLLTVLTLAAFLGLTVSPALAGPPTDRLKEFFSAIEVVLADGAVEPLEKVARVKRLVTEIADVKGAAATALDREWEARTPAEREEFTRLFAELLERGFVARLAGTISASRGIVMSYKGETRLGDEARVLTVLEARDGRRLNVEYRMTERRGRWLVRDVVIDDISTVENYRAQFRRLLRQSSYGDVMGQLRAKLGEETLMFAQATPSMPAPSPGALPAKPTPAPPPPPPPLTLVRPPSPAPRPTPTPMVAKASVPSAPAAVKLSPPPEPKWAPSAPQPVPQTWIAADPAPPRRALVVEPPVQKKPVQAVAAATRVFPQKVAKVTPGASPSAPPEAVSPLNLTGVGLPSALLLGLGLVSVGGAVYMRRRAAAGGLLQRVGDIDERLVLLHPVPRVPKVRERRRKRRVVPATRNPA